LQKSVVQCLLTAQGGPFLGIVVDNDIWLQRNRECSQDGGPYVVSLKYRPTERLSDRTTWRPSDRVYIYIYIIIVSLPVYS